MALSDMKGSVAHAFAASAQAPTKHARHAHVEVVAVPLLSEVRAGDEIVWHLAPQPAHAEGEVRKARQNLDG